VQFDTAEIVDDISQSVKVKVVKMGRLKTREWTTWHQVAGVENSGVSDSGK